ncbi:MAG TPA: helix-turn-helix transcriptional regulator [Actinomycetota bacterium]|nr:helix-turn-helix transcriptional regulator [Actinomycetota bacterium]
MTLEEQLDTNVISLGDRLKAHREERGISQSQAARELEVARTAYRLWEMEAARPAPDRWRLLSRWLGISMTSLLLAEGLISEDEGQRANDAAERYARATGEAPDLAAEREEGDFFRQAQAMIDRSLEQGIVTADEAGAFRDVFERIRDGLGSGRPG